MLDDLVAADHVEVSSSNGMRPFKSARATVIPALARAWPSSSTISTPCTSFAPTLAAQRTVRAVVAAEIKGLVFGQAGSSSSSNRADVLSSRVLVEVGAHRPKRPRALHCLIDYLLHALLPSWQLNASLCSGPDRSTTRFQSGSPQPDALDLVGAGEVAVALDQVGRSRRRNNSRRCVMSPRTGRPHMYAGSESGRWHTGRARSGDGGSAS